MEKVMKNISKFSLVLEMAVIFTIFQILTNGIFMTNANVNNLLMQSCTYAMLGCSMVYVMVIGGIDLSAGATLGFLCTVSATLQVHYKMGTGTTILITLLIGLCIGCWNGYWISYRNMPAFIVTLAGQNIFKGLTLLIGKGVSVGPVNEEFAKYGRGFLPSVFTGGAIKSDASYLAIVFAILLVVGNTIKVRRERVRYEFAVPSLGAEFVRTGAVVFLISALGYVLTQYQGIPNAIVILAILAVVSAFIGKKLPFGRAIYAVGNNKEAARLSGIDTRKATFKVYIMHGLVVALASVIYLGRIGQASATTGTDFEFSAITGCILGGTSTLGGSGTIAGAIIGMIIMASLDNGMSLMNLGTTYQYLIRGFVLLLAVCLDIAGKQKKQA